MTYMDLKGQKLREAEKQLSVASTEEKNLALKYVAEAINRNRKEILAANEKDVQNGILSDMSEGLIDRLKLDDSRIDGIIEGINTVIMLQDPVWKSDRVWTMENGLTFSKMTVPIGVIGIIYESRPNVTVDAFALALKSGNCILLRGSSSAINSNLTLVKAIKEGLKNSSITEDVVEFIDDTDRDLVDQMLNATEYLDLIIPRGGKGLIKLVIDNSSVPTLQTGDGNCHLFVDESANLDDAVNILVNAKTQRIGVCNACETLLVHENIADRFLPMAYEALKDKVELRGDSSTKKIIDVKDASPEDWYEEYLDYILAIKVVRDVDEAIDHINKYGTKHSESIVTENLTNANKFQRQVDAATVYVNASTRFTDGGEFGFGAEMGISTQKIHARGPVGLEQLVSSKYLIMGKGQIRK
ncbi:MAG: glutamate-5-semialdehyde dehydrogenase [Tissierellia bacterium]|jgi:glutamate-5-semialdehyde dehydrogenase|nr:glutamate-5-semialdehyde dehydrogenase [Tissierellia bacterium]